MVAATADGRHIQGEEMLEKVYNPAEIDGKWSAAWKRESIFDADASSPRPPYSIILPPPNVTGQLTVGHALGTTVQDILVRWRRLKGCNVLWLSGTDHAGIATQNVVERYLEKEGLSREALGREKFLEECWKWKDKYHDRIVAQLERLGASLDWSREVFTLDPGVSRAVREVFVRLYEKKLLYRGSYIVNWCPSCDTAISDEEVEFREENSKLYHVAYPFADGSGEVVVGTTRPETMLGDVAVAMSPSDERAPALEGVELILPLAGRRIPVILDDAVDPSFGTGCLKVTPAHDAVDFGIGLRHGLEPFIVIDRAGRMNENAGEFSGMGIAEAREAVLRRLADGGYLRKTEDYLHSVGHHDRCGHVVEPAISKQWFLRMESLAAPALEAVKSGEVSFFPERWGNIYIDWMENIRDWCVSRQLWWGHRIPVWYCAECGTEIVSREDPTLCSRCASPDIVQDEDVLDTWFSSWLWTFSPLGWPDETKDLKVFHPTDVLVTGGDIIFFWVARMVMASIEFMGEIPFSRVYITGIVRDSKGRKMSKSLGNSPDPIDIMERSGADAFRFTLMMLSPPGQDLMFDEEKVETGRHFANKVWNAARFVLGQEAGSADIFAPAPAREAKESPERLFASVYGRAPGCEAAFGWEDRWIVSRAVTRMAQYDNSLEGFRFDEAVKTVYDFFWHEFCDWYLELSKSAFRETGPRGAGAAVTARAVLGLSMIMLHPVMPFISEEIWSMLSPDPPMLAGYAWGGLPAGLDDPKLDGDVEMFREIVTSIRNLRQSFNIPHQRGVEAIISCERGRSIPDKLSPFRAQISSLAKVDRLVIADDAPKPGGSAAAGHSMIDIYVPLGGIVDIEAERKRLSKDRDKLAHEVEKIGRRLADETFTGRAPADVIGRERARFDEMNDRKTRIERILEDLV